MSNDTMNFTTPQPVGGGGGGEARPTGTGDNGETWDPVQKRWVPRSQMPAQYSGDAGNRPVDANGNPTTAYGPGQLGKVDTYNGGAGAPSWGGYNGTNVLGPDGKPMYDPTQSGRAADVNRLRGLANTSANAPAYQMDYGNANEQARLGQVDRGFQEQGIGLARTAALGDDNSMAQQLGRRSLAQGAQAQTAGALSARGGVGAGMAALRTQRAGMAGYMQKGNNQLASLKADEMEQGRNSLQGMAAAQRAGDQQAQGANAQQAIAQGQMENQQRDLNQKQNLGYEGMAQDVNKAAQNTAQAGWEGQMGQSNADLQRDAEQHAGDLRFAGDQLKNYSSQFSSMGGGGGQPSGGVPMSDERVKSMANLYGRRR